MDDDRMREAERDDDAPPAKLAWVVPRITVLSREEVERMRIAIPTPDAGDAAGR